MILEHHPELLESRIVNAPDGLAYLVPLDVYYWNCLTEMEAEGYTDLTEVIGIAWRGKLANERDGRRSDFTFCLNVAIDEMYEHYLTRVFGYANG